MNATGSRMYDDQSDSEKIGCWVSVGVFLIFILGLIGAEIFTIFYYRKKLENLRKTRSSAEKKQLRPDYKDHQDEIHSLERSLAEVQKQYQQTILQLNQEIQKLKSENSKLKSRSRNSQEYQDLHTVLERQGRNIGDLTQQVYEKDQEIINLKNIIDHLESGENVRMTNDRNITELKYQIEARERDLSEKVQEITNFKNVVENLESRNSEKENETRSQKRIIDDLNRTIESRDKDIHMLNVAIGRKQENCNQNKEIKNLREEHNAERDIKPPTLPLSPSSNLRFLETVILRKNIFSVRCIPS